MGPKNSKSKAQSIKYYHQYLDEQKHQIYEKHEEISSKMLELNSYSKKFNHALSPTEKCMSFCLDSMGMKEVKNWRKLLKIELESNNLEFKWFFLKKLLTFPIENEYIFVEELKTLDFKYGFFTKKKQGTSDITEIQECDFLNSIVDIKPQNSTSFNSPETHFLFNKEVEDFKSKKSLDLSVSLKIYSFNLKKTLRSRHQSDFPKNLKSLKEKDKLMQELHCKELIKVLNSHVKNPLNLMYFAKKLFFEYFKKSYEKKLNENLKNEEIEKYLIIAVRDLKSYIKLITEIIVISYNLNKYRLIFTQNLITKDCIQSFVLNSFYNSIGNIFEKTYFMLNNSEIEILKAKMIEYCDFSPQNFDIIDKYCLNERTFKEKSSKDFIFEPYSKTIENLKEIIEMKSPAEKIEQIMKTAEILYKEINEFYEAFDEKFDEEIGGDDILSIFVYVITKSQCYELYIQCKLIDIFMTNNQINSIAGYYLATIQVGIKYICNMNKKLK